MNKSQKGIILPIVIIIVLAVVVAGGYLVYKQNIASKKSVTGTEISGTGTPTPSATPTETPTATPTATPTETPTETPTDQTAGRIVELTVWPDVNSFDLTNRTFLAKGVGIDAKKYVSPLKIVTNSSTKYYSMGDGKIIGYFDFEKLYSSLKNWIGPIGMFTIKGSFQNDDSVLADEIILQTQ